MMGNSIFRRESYVSRKGADTVEVFASRSKNDFIVNMVLRSEDKQFLTFIKRGKHRIYMGRMYYPSDALSVVWYNDTSMVSFYYYLIPYDEIQENFNVLFVLKDKMYSVPASAIRNTQLNPRNIIVDEDKATARKVFVPFDFLEQFKLQS